MNFFIGCCEKQPVRKLGQRLRSYEKENRSLIPAGDNYPNLFVGYVEERIFDQFDGPVPELFGRYIDDCFGATSCGRPELDRFIQFVNTFHPALEFIWEISTSSVTFLDINVSIQNDGSLQTRRFAQLFASFLIPSASCKKFNSLLSISPASSTLQ